MYHWITFFLQKEWKKMIKLCDDKVLLFVNQDNIMKYRDSSHIGIAAGRGMLNAQLYTSRIIQKGFQEKEAL